MLKTTGIKYGNFWNKSENPGTPSTPLHSKQAAHDPPARSPPGRSCSSPTQGRWLPSTNCCLSPVPILFSGECVKRWQVLHALVLCSGPRACCRDLGTGTIKCKRQPDVLPVQTGHLIYGHTRAPDKAPDCTWDVFTSKGRTLGHSGFWTSRIKSLLPNASDQSTSASSDLCAKYL